MTTEVETNLVAVERIQEYQGSIEYRYLVMFLVVLFPIS
jgi:hypothetical protein